MEAAKRLRRLVMGLLASVALLLFGAAPALAQTDDVASTKHNLSATSGGGAPSGATIVDYGEICVYCHTPHGGQIDAPLWNRQFSTATYQMYTSSTIDMTADGSPTGVSQACLSCHDGTIGLDVVINPPNTWGPASSVPPTNTAPGGNVMPSSSDALLDTDLRNDHPISIVYDPVQDPAFNPQTNVEAAGLRFFQDPSSPGDKVQCASCHNPHDDTNTPFLRMANSSSALCTTCHIK